MRILVTGGCGFLGDYIVKELSKYDRFLVANMDCMMYTPHYLDSYEFYYGDVTDYVRYAEVLEEFKPDVVINTAAIVGDPACAVNPIRTKDVNQDSVKWLSENFGGKIIQISTCSVYGVNDDLLNEESPTNPISVYAETKLAAEEYLDKDKDLIFRLGTLYGATTGRPRLDLVVNIFSMLSALDQPITVNNPEALRPILHAKDVGGAISYGLMKELTGLYILSQQNMSIGQIAANVQVAVPTPVDVIYSEKKEDLRNYMVSTEKIKETGWNPRFTLESGIMDVYNIVREKRIKDPFSELYHNGKFVSIIEGNN